MSERGRYLEDPLQKDVLQAGKMAFISGPRQVGKTTLALALAKKYPTSTYYNWDDTEFRRHWVKSPTSLLSTLSKGSCVVFDEIHKSHHWKRNLKGIYDLSRGAYKIIVTGSAQLDTFRKGGESLMGRYFHVHLHPYSLGELQKNKHSSPEDLTDFLRSPTAHSSPSSLRFLKDLLEWSGFPDPFETQRPRHLKMWRRSRLEKLIREDLRDLTRVMELSRLDLLASLLPERIGSLLSVKSLAEDMEVSQPTLKNWLMLLEKVFLHYKITPYSKHMARALKKESKLYLWDWTQLKEEGRRLENFVASALLKAVDYWTELGYGEYRLHFYRDKEKREVDFVVTREEEPWLLIEVKSSQKQVHPLLRYLSKQWPKAHAIQLIKDPHFYHFHREDNIHVISMANFLERLP